MERDHRRPSPQLGLPEHEGEDGDEQVDTGDPQHPREPAVAAVQQVTEEDEELVLISEGGQVIRTETNTINRYSSGARGVIVMRLAEGDRVAAIAAFRPGLADRDGMGDDGAPASGGPGQAGPSA